MYKTNCPKCNTPGSLFVVAGIFSASGMHLSEDGFSFSDANQVHTSDEVISCDACGKKFSLDDLMEDCD